MTVAISKPEGLTLHPEVLDKWEKTKAFLAIEAASNVPTPEQAEIILRIANEIHTGGFTPVHASLKGPAGTGKTTTLTGLIVMLAFLGRTVQVTAFTHKACSVLDAKINKFRTALLSATQISVPEAKTLHSLLCLKPKAAKFGEKETFSQTKQPRLGTIDLFIVDECSMIGEDLFNYIEKDIRKKGFHLLYAGDACQLRPVGENEKSKTFSTTTKFKLTQVLRHDGAILDLATSIRTLRYIPQFTPMEGDDSRVVLHEGGRGLVRAWMAELQEDTENVKMLCYTNANRRHYNDQARVLMYGEDAPRFRKGDIILTLAPIVRDDRILFNNNESVVVREEPELRRVVPVKSLGLEYNVWALPTDSGILYVLDSAQDEKQYIKDFKALGREIAAQVKKAGSDFRKVRDAKLRWSSEYFPLKNFFADVDFHYAMTIHKSQGSTFDKVFIHDDYLKARADQKRLLYVAVTRAAKEVHLVDNRY